MSVAAWALACAGLWLYLCGGAVTWLCQRQARTYSRWQIVLGVALWPVFVTAHCALLAWALAVEIGDTAMRRWRA